MQHERPILVHKSFLDQLLNLSRSDVKLERIVKDKVRVLASCDDVKKYGTKLSNEGAKRYFGNLLHIDVGKRNRRLFVLMWDAALSKGGNLEILLPLAVSERRDEIQYSNLKKYVEICDSIVRDFSVGGGESFSLWQVVDSGIVESELRDWPFATS